jgi:hypothetical protein
MTQQLGSTIRSEELAYAMAQILSNLVGYDVTEYCNLALKR